MRTIETINGKTYWNVTQDNGLICLEDKYFLVEQGVSPLSGDLFYNNLLKQITERVNSEIPKVLIPHYHKVIAATADAELSLPILELPSDDDRDLLVEVVDGKLKTEDNKVIIL